MKHYRICITRLGYAVVAGRTEEDALKNAENLSANDIDWEPFSAEMLQDAEIVEECNEDGSISVRETSK